MNEIKKAAISFKIRIHREWVSIDEFIDDPDYLLSYYLELGNLSRSVLQGGFFIDADGISWNNDQCVDEFKTTNTWFSAIEKLLNGVQAVEIWIGEESGLIMELNGTAIELEYIHHSGEIVCPRVAFDFYDFVKQMLAEGRKFAMLAIMLREAIKPLEKFNANDIAIDAIKDKVKTLKDNLPEDLYEKIDLMEIVLEDFKKIPGTHCSP